MDSSGEPLSIGETLSNLMEVAEELQNSGFLQGAEVDSVSAVNPSKRNIEASVSDSHDVNNTYGHNFVEHFLQLS